jgi:CRISPR/Cas system-associated exonuclease Cas4 (RecB family)
MTWIVAVCLAGFPVAGVLAWIFDWTRQGIVRTAPISADQRAILAQGRRRRRRRLALAGFALALTAAIGAIWWQTRWRSSGPERPKTEAIERKP